MVASHRETVYTVPSLQGEAHGGHLSFQSIPAEGGGKANAILMAATTMQTPVDEHEQAVRDLLLLHSKGASGKRKLSMSSSGDRPQEKKHKGRGSSFISDEGSDDDLSDNSSTEGNTLNDLEGTYSRPPIVDPNLRLWRHAPAPPSTHPHSVVSDLLGNGSAQHKASKGAAVRLGRPRNVSDLRMEEIVPTFHLALGDAAKALGICATMLKQQCRRLGVRSWPYRQIRKYETMLNKLTRSKPYDSDKEKVISQAKARLEELRTFGEVKRDMQGSLLPPRSKPVPGRNLRPAKAKLEEAQQDKNPSSQKPSSSSPSSANSHNSERDREHNHERQWTQERQRDGKVWDRVAAAGRRDDPDPMLQLSSQEQPVMRRNDMEMNRDHPPDQSKTRTTFSPSQRGRPGNKAQDMGRLSLLALASQSTGDEEVKKEEAPQDNAILLAQIAEVQADIGRLSQELSKNDRVAQVRSILGRIPSHAHGHNHDGRGSTQQDRHGRMAGVASQAQQQAQHQAQQQAQQQVQHQAQQQAQQQVQHQAQQQAQQQAQHQAQQQIHFLQQQQQPANQQEMAQLRILEERTSRAAAENMMQQRVLGHIRALLFQRAEEMQTKETIQAQAQPHKKEPSSREPSKMNADEQAAAEDLAQLASIAMTNSTSVLTSSPTVELNGQNQHHPSQPQQQQRSSIPMSLLQAYVKQTSGVGGAGGIHIKTEKPSSSEANHSASRGEHAVDAERVLSNFIKRSISSNEEVRRLANFKLMEEGSSLSTKGMSKMLDFFRTQAHHSRQGDMNSQADMTLRAATAGLNSPARSQMSSLNRGMVSDAQRNLIANLGSPRRHVGPDVNLIGSLNSFVNQTGGGGMARASQSDRNHLAMGGNLGSFNHQMSKLSRNAAIGAAERSLTMSGLVRPGHQMGGRSMDSLKSNGGMSHPAMTSDRIMAMGNLSFLANGRQSIPIRLPPAVETAKEAPVKAESAEVVIKHEKRDPNDDPPAPHVIIEHKGKSEKDILDSDGGEINKGPNHLQTS